VHGDSDRFERRWDDVSDAPAMPRLTSLSHGAG
jgi:hypothetical protein